MDETRPTAFARLLSEAIRASGLTLDAIRLRLQDEDVRISVATLSYWQNGRSQPTSAHAVRTLGALEHVLDLPSGTLVRHAPVAQTRSRGSVATRTRFPVPSDVSQAVAMAGMDPQALRKVSTHLTMTVGEDRTFTSEVVRNVVQCLVPGTSRFPLVASGDGVRQDVTGLSWCATGDGIELEGGLLLTEMLLPRPLRQGELVMLEYMTAFGPGGDVAGDVRLAAPKMNELVLDVQFFGRDLPRRVVGFSHDPAAERTGQDEVELPVAAGSAQLVLLDMPPSMVGMDWDW